MEYAEALFILIGVVEVTTPKLVCTETEEPCSDEKARVSMSRLEEDEILRVFLPYASSSLYSELLLVLVDTGAKTPVSKNQTGR